MKRPWRCTAVAAIALLSCRRRTESSSQPSIAPEPSTTTAASSATDAAQGSASDAGAKVALAKPRPVPKGIACVPDPRVRWATPPPSLDEIATVSSGEAAFGCSPFNTGSSPLELTVAPGTILSFPVVVEVSDEVGDGSVFHPAGEVKYTTADMPKGAWVDPDAAAFKWHVAGAQGEAFAFSVAASVALPEGPRCVTASMVVVVRDDASTREAQARWITREENVRAAAAPFKEGEPDFLEFEDRARCGNPMSDPRMIDADGDGLDDAIFVRTSPVAGVPASTMVYVRRGETFASLGTEMGVFEQASDGTSFIVDVTSGNGSDAKVFQVFKNGIRSIFYEKSQAAAAPEGNVGVMGGFRIDRTGSAFIGLTDEAGSPSGATTTRTWRWNGKRFALTP